MSSTLLRSHPTVDDLPRPLIVHREDWNAAEENDRPPPPATDMWLLPGSDLTHQFREADIIQIILVFSVGLVAAKLADDAKRLRLLSTTDDLTGLHNLRSFESHLASLASRARKNGSTLSVLVLDVDHLKSLNDNYGHLAGADAVRTVGHLIAQYSPARAVACRYGGDEFVVAIPDCEVEDAVEIAELLRQSVSEVEPVLATHSFPSGTLSISIGTASRLIGKDADLSEVGEALFRTADQALYRAKENGR